MKKIFLAMFLLVFCACFQSENKQSQNAEQNTMINTEELSLENMIKACENKEKNACITAFALINDNENASADELKKAYALAKKGCKNAEDMSCVFYAQALLFGVFDDENTKEGLKILENSCQNGGAMSCANLSDIYFFGHFNQNKDEQKAKLYLEKICQNSKDYCPMSKAMEQSHAQISQSPNLAIPPQNLWLGQNIVRENRLKTYELGAAPEGVTLDVIDFATNTNEKLVCDAPQSNECKEFLDEQCKGQENEEFCRSYTLTWNSSPRHESIAYDSARFFLEKMVNEYNKDEFIYFVKYAYNKRLALPELLSLTAGYDENTGDRLPLILALAKKDATEQLREIRRIYSISIGDAKLMELFREYKISPKIAAIFTK